MGTYTAPPSPYGPSTRPLPSFPPGQLQVMPKPLTADDVRQIIREELDRGKS